MGKVIVIGSSGHAKVVIDILEREGRSQIVGLLDRFRERGERTLGYEILGREEDLPALASRHALSGVLVAIGDNFLRAQVAAQVAGLCPGLPFAQAIHPGAWVAKDVSIGEGSVLMAGAVVNPSSRIGRFCILNT